MSKIKWIIFSIITIGIFASLVVFSENSSIDTSNIDIEAIQVANSQNGNIGDHVYGNTNSKVILINYGDFQCSGCGYQHVTTKAIAEEYKDKIQFVFRNFTIPTLHPNAKAAAATVEAAGLQNKYWEMYNKVYESQADWENLTGTERADFFSGYAKELGLDINKFNADIASSNIIKKIDYDKALGTKAGVDATPTFYLNGTKLEGAVWGNKAKLEEAINAELKKVNVALPTNTN